MSEYKSSPAPLAIAGICGAFAFAVLWLVAVFADSSWVFGENTLSDLGVSEVSAAADAFNFGCMITGCLVVIYGIGKAWSCKGYAAASGAYILVSGILLVLIGLFTEDSGNIHNYFAILFFILILLAVIITAVGDSKAGNNLFAAVGGIVALIAISGLFIESIEGAEAIAVICILAWLVFDSIKLALSKA